VRIERSDRHTIAVERRNVGAEEAIAVRGSYRGAAGIALLRWPA
jgi:hypothetical protein